MINGIEIQNHDKKGKKKKLWGQKSEFFIFLLFSS